VSTFADLDWPIRTERLTIRPATADDAEAVWRFRRLPSVAEWINRQPTDFTTWSEGFCQPDRLATTLVVELEDEVIGDLMLELEDAWSQVEVKEQAAASQAILGWVMHPDVAGRGYATEAVRALIELAFGPLGMRRVTAYCFEANEPSWRLMERLGMRRENHNLKDSLHRTKGWMDGLGYGLLAEEWTG
jgi:RimJ/RimL family protein N-acetyltransferase